MSYAASPRGISREPLEAAAWSSGLGYDTRLAPQRKHSPPPLSAQTSGDFAAPAPARRVRLRVGFGLGRLPQLALADPFRRRDVLAQQEEEVGRPRSCRDTSSSSLTPTVASLKSRQQPSSRDARRPCNARTRSCRSGSRPHIVSRRGQFIPLRLGRADVLPDIHRNVRRYCYWCL